MQKNRKLIFIKVYYILIFWYSNVPTMATYGNFRYGAYDMIENEVFLSSSEDDDMIDVVDIMSTCQRIVKDKICGHKSKMKNGLCDYHRNKMKEEIEGHFIILPTMTSKHKKNRSPIPKCRYKDKRIYYENKYMPHAVETFCLVMTILIMVWCSF